MVTSKLFVGIFSSLVGLLFFFNNKNIGKGAYNFYKKFYTENNLKMMFKILGVFLFIIGIVIAITK
ncbi:hypothetical protein KY358_05850 [Candidatus Woesearchaeota archaeon]|nr:hypothetical protein [Candidatus Woesearchaeota archaeon]